MYANLSFYFLDYIQFIHKRSFELMQLYIYQNPSLNSTFLFSFEDTKILIVHNFERKEIRSTEMSIVRTLETCDGVSLLQNLIVT
jgi:hypothetical protein